ncbi:MAG: hydantoinase/oxoprolinase family protein [Alphaproteobacteria bacterium]|nr:hydantoinase/oxoprolinase family protein [Alphaproteobacteria bacterium]
MAASRASIARTAIVGVDVGGTFTDIFWLDEATGECRVAKVPSTPDDQSRGFIEGVVAGAEESGIPALANVVHGTTVGTNALLERKGAKAGLITTAGFRDILEMRRRDRPEIWGLRGSYTPVIPRDMRLEVEERVLADGSVRTPVDIDAVSKAVADLLAAGAEALAIMFVNSYANPENERAAYEAAKAVWPNEHITVSSDILPELREFERASTTALNATLQPVIGRYLQNLEASLNDAGFEGDILIVQSNGGVMSVDTAREIPVRTALSGPAAGVIAAAHIAKAAGFPNIVTCDMGGTSFDVALVADGESALAAQTSIDFGLVVRTPMIQITTIGAGGGSIARVDRGGILQIGPESAGANPGPACYGLGNDRPTVTDANVLLGRINAERPIGGKINALDLDAAARAIRTHVGEPLGLDDLDAAEAIIRVANSRMAGAIRLVSIERGHDPRKFTAMPFGGGGALHAGALVNEVGLSGALVPRFPGVTSAIGCVIADMRHDFVQTLNTLLDELDLTQLAAGISRLAGEGRERLACAGVTLEETEEIVELDMLYVGQTHTVVTPVVAGTDSIDALHAAFEAAYRREYGRVLDGIPCRVMNLRVSVIGHRPNFDLSVLAPSGDASLEAAERPGRKVYVQGAWHDARVYDRLMLPVGTVIPGPAILEQPDATTFVDPGLSGRVDSYGNVIVERES